MKRCRRAFSLLEVIAVALILGILAVYVIPRLLITAADARDETNDYNKLQINGAVERYTTINGSLPDTIDDIDHPDYLPGGIPNNPVNGQPYTLDPITKRADDGS